MERTGISSTGALGLVSTARCAATVFFFEELEELQLTNKKFTAINSENIFFLDIDYSAAVSRNKD
jgi:hypothetical protein